MNVICQNKNCNKKWTNIILLELKSTTISLFLCENHAINLEHELLPKWLKTCEKLRKNKKEKFIMKTWIKTNLSKITLALALIGATTGTIGLIMGVLTHNFGTNVKHYLDHNKQMVFGTSTIWERKNNGKDIMDLYFAINKFTDDAIKWDGTYPIGYFNK